MVENIVLVLVSLVSFFGLIVDDLGLYTLNAVEFVICTYLPTPPSYTLCIKAQFVASNAN